MIIFLLVVLLGPLQYSLDGSGVPVILMRLVYQVCRVTRDIDSVDLVELFEQIFVFLFEIHRDNSSSCAFQKLDVGILDVRFLVEKFFP